jgi:Rrf2 family protein
MMVELARELKKEKIVHLGRIAGITGLSENYLAQLAISLRNDGLLIGVAGKKGGYMLGRAAEEIKISEIIKALTGPVSLTDCVNNPDICLNSGFCEARMIWVILSGRMLEFLDEYSLAELVDKNRLDRIRRDFDYMPLLNPDRVLSESGETMVPDCPAGLKNKKK